MVRPKFPILSEWEQTLLQLIWERNAATANDIVEDLSTKQIHRSNSAIRTTLSSLEKKGYLKHRIQDNTYIYYATVSNEDVENDALDYVKKVFFNGSLHSMLLRLVNKDEITPEQILELKNQLEEVDKN
ncbi:MAG: BlaI/MecI/CopY family transcriptional regulator [Candidatus Hinthialibacter antarcticus]|nr:BlaI/MecI/CopY family transcriptional regulator [Candidatus Hinthialibacter antarcticus]